MGPRISIRFLFSTNGECLPSVDEESEINGEVGWWK